MRSTLIRLIVLLAVAAVAGTAYYLVRRLPERKKEIPTVQVKRGDLVVRNYVRGELRAIRSTALTTPNLGATSQITRLAPTGALAKAKDLIVELDDSELLAALEDDELEVAQVEERIKKSEADLKIRHNQDQVDLLRARYAVRRAELEVRRNELISAIDARKNVLTLEEAKRSLTKLEEDIKSRQLQGEAELAVLREQRRKSMIDVNRSKSRIQQTKILAPMSGLVSIQQNRGGDGRFMMFGQQTPDIREGDQVYPGMAVAQILDLSELEVMTRVNEIERANLSEGQEVLVRLDALPGKVVNSKIKSLSGAATTNVFAGDPVKRFDCSLSIDMRQLLAHVGAAKDQIDRILAMAAENAKRFQSGSGSAGPMLAAAGGPGFAETPGAMGRGGRAERGAGGPGGEQGGLEGRRGGGGPGGERGGEGGGFDRRREGGAGGPGGGSGGSDPDRQRMRQMFEQALGGRNMQDLSQEERQKMFAELRQKMGGAGGPGASGMRTPGGPGGGPGPGADFPSAGARGGGEGGPTRMNLPRGAGPGGGRGAPESSDLPTSPLVAQRFSPEDLEKAELASPPSENSMMDILLRPGLLVEAEIIVEKIPNTIYVPQQGVFEKGDKQVVYVRAGDRFEQRVVKPGKRTESQVSILEGLRDGDWIALADLEAGQRAPSKKEKTSPQRSQPALPGKSGGDLVGGGRGGPG